MPKLFSRIVSFLLTACVIGHPINLGVYPSVDIHVSSPLDNFKNQALISRLLFSPRQVDDPSLRHTLQNVIRFERHQPSLWEIFGGLRWSTVISGSGWNLRSDSYAPASDFLRGLAHKFSRRQRSRGLSASSSSDTMSAADIKTLDWFINNEALKISDRYWELLPFVPNRARPPIPKTALQTPFMQRYLRGYQIALRIHGAPEENHPFNNQLAQRQMRDNGAPYIIHILGIIWASIHISNITQGKIFITNTNHDVQEDGVKYIRKAHPELSTQQAEILIDQEFRTTLGNEAEEILLLLRWYDRGGRTYRTYIDAFKKAPLDILLSKLLDQANNLYDIPYLMTHGKKDRAQRQVGKTLRYFSELLSLEEHQQDPRYRDTVIYLLKILVQSGNQVDWLEPYYERESGSRKPSEDIAQANPEILDGLDRFQKLLKKPWVRKAMSEEQKVWGAPVSLERLDRFSARTRDLRQRIHDGVALPTQYTDPEAWTRRGLERDSYILAIAYKAQNEMTQEEVHALIETAVTHAGGLRTGEYVVDFKSERKGGLVLLKTALHRPLGASLAAVEEKIDIFLRASLRLHDVTIRRPGQTEGDSYRGETSDDFPVRFIIQDDENDVRKLFQRSPASYKTTTREDRFLKTFQQLLAKEIRGFGLAWDGGAVIFSAVLAVLENKKAETTLRIIDLVFAKGEDDTGKELLLLVIDMARKLPFVQRIVVNSIDELLDDVLERLEFKMSRDGRQWTWHTPKRVLKQVA